MTEPFPQLSLDLDDPEPTLAEALRPPQRLPTGPSGGPARLLRDLVKHGLSAEALPAAAALVLVLDTPRSNQGTA